MNNIFLSCLLSFLRFLLWFRYSIQVKGLDKLTPQILDKPGGVLFLPNHPSLLDPVIVMTILWHRFQPRPLVVEYSYRTSWIYPFMKVVRALPIPNFGVSGNVLKKRKAEQSLERVAHCLQQGHNMIVYPAGRLQYSENEVVGGASGTYRILSMAPEANVVIVKTTGLWGSSFSRALTGEMPSFGKELLKGALVILKNLILFTPRRRVTIELMPAPDDFPCGRTKMELNRYLENIYNAPGYGRKEPGFVMKLVPYSVWTQKVVRPKAVVYEKNGIDLTQISQVIRKKVLEEIALVSERNIDDITEDMDLSTDLGLDSLSNAELVVFLDDYYGIKGVRPQDLTTVAAVMLIAAQKLVPDNAEYELHLQEKAHRAWSEGKRPEVLFVQGDTLAEVFLQSCKRMGSSVACADDVVGIMTYKRMNVAAILLANQIRQFKGKHVGILLPACVAADLVILACVLAQKIPVMLNWTVGPRFIAYMKELMELEVVVSEWTFLDRLENVDLLCIADEIVLLSEMKGKVKWKEKAQAYWLAMQPPSAVLKKLGLDKVSPDEPAVFLSTSGTEGIPKCVPLSHRNILTNQRAAMQAVEITSDDCMLGFLPPFHSFGFSATGIFPLFTGIKVAYFPDPFDSIRLAKAIDRWGGTVICTAPTFLSKLLKVAKSEQIKSVRLVISGAEKASKGLVDMLHAVVPRAKFVEGYGITECSPVIALSSGEEESLGRVKPVQDVEIKILDINTFDELSIEQQGLVVVRGPNVFDGYYKSDRDPFVVIDGKRWYNTGDLGKVDEQGRLALVGRLKRFVKIGGEMIGLPALEEALVDAAIEKKWVVHEEEGVHFAITAYGEEGEHLRLVLYTTAEITLDEVNRAIKAYGYSNLARISHINRVDEIPLLATGKVNFGLLKEQSP
ncbi:AMP-binding protein [Simkania negevensis]|uniref:AMP-binding protein n=1 Tax=Simkania negevensis TaxID=83561 RepID=A0ABS3ASI4_9BACT|nr:AMP-binding protein [Simkania negevensis]